VKFLITIEEFIDLMIVRLLKKLNDNTPPFVFKWIAFVVHLPQLLKKKYQLYLPKMRIIRLKFIGHIEHYVTIFRGYITSFIIYLRSEEFKHINKVTLLLTPIRYVKGNPLKALSGFFALIILTYAGTLLYQSTAKIVVGTNALRKPASLQAEEDVFIEFKNHKFEVTTVPAKTAHETEHDEAEHDLFLDMTIEATDSKEKEYLNSMQETLEENIDDLKLSVTQLPLTEENRKQIENYLTLSLNAAFQKIGHQSPIKTIKIKQVLPGRPSYYRQTEKIFSVTDISLQLFLEDTHRNRQAWIDFSIVASNRNVILYLKDHEIELKDHLTNNVEPVIPQLPVEEEGRLIIKDKLKMEVNQFLQKNGIEGKVLEIYIDYLMVS
jgi:hypothetical protein